MLVPFSPPAALTLAAAGAVGAVALAALIAVLERLRRQRIDDAILAGQTAPVAIFEEERQRLSGHHAHVMAKALARALHSAVHWREIPPSLRPVQGIRLLEPYRDQVTAIIDGLRRPDVPPEAVILVEHLLVRGLGSGTGDGDQARLREALSRIQYLLDQQR